MGICLMLRGQDACQDGLGHFLEKDLTTLQNGGIGPEKKCPRVPVWVRGGGSNCYLGIGQCPNELRLGFGMASLNEESIREKKQDFQLLLVKKNSLLRKSKKSFP